MLLTLAWRNIWRSKTRSFVVIGAIIVGVWSVIFLLGFMHGMVRTYINTTIENRVSHFQIHHADYNKEKDIKYYLEDGEAALAKLQSNPNIKAASTRTRSNIMIASAKATRGLEAVGILPEQEAALTQFNTKIVEGEYFGKKKKNPLLISRRIADKLKVKIRSKVVLTFQDINGEITSGAFRIIGIFATGNNPFDDMHVYTQQSDLNRLLGLEKQVHEVAIYLNEVEQVAAEKPALVSLFPKQLVETYKEVSPDIELYETQIQISTMVIMFIIMLALVFGIINTMLMAVLERFKELGMLMAIGMNKVNVFFMIMIETILLGVIGAPIGILIGYLTIYFSNKKGIDLSNYASGMSEFGIASFIRPWLETHMYWQLALAVFLTTLVASIYPSYKAVKLKPVEAMRKL